MKLENIDHVAVIDDNLFETTSVDGDITIYHGVITSVKIPSGDSKAFVIEYENFSIISDDVVKGAKESLKDQFDTSGDSPWLEGWICGFTDNEHGYSNNNKVYNELFDYLAELRNI